MKVNTVKTITELFLDGAISLDRSAEPLSIPESLV